MQKTRDMNAAEGWLNDLKDVYNPHIHVLKSWDLTGKNYCFIWEGFTLIFAAVEDDPVMRQLRLDNAVSTDNVVK